MGVLPVPPGVSAVLDGELRTAVQAAQAHGALLLDPDRPPLPHLDGLYGAVRRTSAAADAALLQAEVGRLPDRSVVEGLREPLREKRGGTGGHPAVGMARTDPADGRVNVRLRGFGESRHLLRGGEVEDGSPGVRHPDGVEGVDGPAPDRPARHAAGGPRRCAVGDKEAEVAGMETGLREELLDDAGKAPEIGGRHDAEDVVREGGLAAPKAVHQGYRILPQGRRQPVGHVLAVPGGGKI